MTNNRAPFWVVYHMDPRRDRFEVFDTEAEADKHRADNPKIKTLKQAINKKEQNVPLARHQGGKGRNEEK